MIGVKKISIRVKERGVQVQAHFCYLPAELYEALRKIVPDDVPMNHWFKERIVAWCKDDFLGRDSDKDVVLNTLWDVYLLRTMIRENYYIDNLDKRVLKGIRNNQTVYIQGIVKEWLSEHVVTYLKGIVSGNEEA